MQIERLAYFVEVAKVQSINSASEKLHISQQALSQSMRSLEKELGVSLFERSNKGIRLTEKGELVWQAALDITQRWEQLQVSLAQEDALAGKVQMTIAPFLEMTYLVPLMAYMAVHYPQLTLCTKNAYLDEALALVQTEQSDLAVVSFLEIDGQRVGQLMVDLQFLPIQHNKLDVLVSRQSALARQSALTFAELREVPIVLEKAEDPEHFMLVDLLNRYQCHNWRMVNSFYTAQQMVADNLAVTFTIDGASTLTAYQEQVVRIRLEEKVEITSGALFLQRRQQEPLVAAVLKGLSAH